MTTVAVKAVTEGWEWAWDSQVTFGNMRQPLTGGNSFSKVFTVETTTGQVIKFGGAGSLRLLNAMVHMKLAAFDEGDVDSYVVQTLVPAVNNLMADSGDMNITTTEFDLMVELDGRAFIMGGDMTVFPINDFFAVGSGSEFALGAMEFGASAREAVAIAAKYDIFTGGVIHG